MHHNKCASCGKGTASVRVVELDGWTVKSHAILCETCAADTGHARGDADPASPSSTNVLSGLMSSMGQLVDVSRRRPQPGTVCPGCRMTAADFRQTGRFGCPRCYEVFREPLLPVLNKVHDSTAHRGRFPGPATSAAKRPVDVAELRRRLAIAIAQEQYEEAARLRDALDQAGAGEEAGT